MWRPRILFIYTLLIQVLEIPVGDGRFSATENNVLDTIGRESARIRALPVPDMPVGFQTPAALTVPPPPADFEEQVANATFVFADELESGKPSTG